jgi:hypothetical protein
MVTFKEVLRAGHSNNHVEKAMYSVASAVLKFFSIEDRDFNSICKIVLQAKEKDYEDSITLNELAEETSLLFEKFGIQVLLRFDGEDLYDQIIDRRTEE